MAAPTITTPVVAKYDVDPSTGELILEGTAPDGELRLFGLKIDPSAKEITVQIVVDQAKIGNRIVSETDIYEFAIYRKITDTYGRGEFYSFYDDAHGLTIKFTATPGRPGYHTDEYYIAVSAKKGEFEGQDLSGRFLIRIGTDLGPFTVNGKDYRAHIWGDDWLQANTAPPPPAVVLPLAAQPTLQPESKPEPLHDTYASAPYHLDTARGVWTQGGADLAGVPASDAGLLRGLATTYYDDAKDSLLAMRDRVSDAAREAIDKVFTPEVKAKVEAYKLDESDAIGRLAEMAAETRDAAEFPALEAAMAARREAFASGLGILLNLKSVWDLTFGRTTTSVSHSDILYRMDVDYRSDKPLLQFQTGHQDVFLGSVDRDWVDGGDQRDVLLGYEGDDLLFGADGNDLISGGVGKDYLRGDAGNDQMVGGADFDDINGNLGNDTASGGLGDDWVVGGKDNDSLAGDAGNDIVYGNLGNDTCDGGDGNDIVRGGQGDDVIFGGAGADYVSGDRGSDTVYGGTGADIFHTFGDNGVDRVMDFSRLQGDRVMLEPGTTYSVAQVGSDVVISMAGGGQMVLVDVQLSSLPSTWIFTG